MNKRTNFYALIIIRIILNFVIAFTECGWFAGSNNICPAYTRWAIIEIDISGKPAETSSEQARGFVGIAFRINNENSKFECIYLRPTNGRADEQIRRNHSVQYTSYPDFPWFKLRKDFPEKYEGAVINAAAACAVKRHLTDKIKSEIKIKRK